MYLTTAFPFVRLQFLFTVHRASQSNFVYISSQINSKCGYIKWKLSAVSHAVCHAVCQAVCHAVCYAVCQAVSQAVCYLTFMLFVKLSVRLSVT